MKVNVSWENEEVPTNGKILGFGERLLQREPERRVHAGAGGSPAARSSSMCAIPRTSRSCRRSRPPTTRSSACSTASTSTARRGRSSTREARSTAWRRSSSATGRTRPRRRASTSSSCHHMREISPGIILTACQPFAVLSVLKKDGGSPAHPKVLYTGEAAKFVHSSRWPRQGRDELLLTGGEANFKGRCELNDSEFSTYSAKNVLKKKSKQFEGPLYQIAAGRQRRLRRRQARRRGARAARSTGSRSTGRSRTAASSPCRSTRTACASSR